MLSQVLESRLVLNEEKLLCDDVPVVCGRNTVFMHFSQVVPGVSCTPEIGRMQLEVGPQVSLKRTRYARVAKMLREGPGEALGEREQEEDLGAFMVILGCTNKVAQEQVAKLARARAFVASSQPELVTLEGGKVEEELELMEGEEEESEDGEEVEVSGDDGPDWRRTAWGETVVESTGTVTRKAEEKGMSTVAEVGNVVSEVSVAVASVSEQTDFPRFAKRAKTHDFAQLSSEVPAMSKLQSSQLDQRGHAGSKIQYAQPI